MDFLIPSKTSPALYVFIQPDREHRDITMSRCSRAPPRNAKADLENYNSTHVPLTLHLLARFLRRLGGRHFRLGFRLDGGIGHTPGLGNCGLF